MENTIELSSGTVKQFKKNFVIGEDFLKRLQGVMERVSRESEVDTAVVFHVEREDDRFYETLQVEEVLADRNAKGHRVVVVSIELRAPAKRGGADSRSHETLAAVRFLAGKNFRAVWVGKSDIEVRINSRDSRLALLLADELDQEVEKAFCPQKKFPRWIFLLFLLPLSVFLVRYVTEPNSWPLMPFLVGIVASFLVAISVVPLSLFQRQSTFFWGDEVQEFVSRNGLRMTIFMSASLVLFISGVASIVYFLLGTG